MSDDAAKFSAPFSDGFDPLMYRMEARNETPNRFEFGMIGGGAYQEEKFAGTPPIDAFHAARLAVWLVERLPPDLVGMIGSAVSERSMP